jgi:ABC-type oligopeptide transport system substrate-binding subunit/DNA-binding SARP family transcriptional activator
MRHLQIHLLGTFQAALNDQSIAGFDSNKVRALLAYLAVEADRPHARDELIGLLWPDQPDTAARASLRQALANLRQIIGDRISATPFIATTSDSIQFQRTEQCAIDVVVFNELSAECRAHTHRRIETCRSCAQRLQQAIELYRGDFLAQFVQSGSEAFEEWALIKRERLHREVLDALYHLTQHFEWRGDYILTLHYARRQLELDPWREEAHRQAMRALALTEQRSAALAQYEACRRVLAQELGAEPAEETTALYEQIKVGTVTSDVQQRPWLTPATPLIGRESELAEANAIWHKARTGEGQVLLISGEPGIGKTRLVQELIAQERYDNVLILTGECYAEGGAPFAPIAQVLQAAVDLRGASRNLGGVAPSIIADLITFVPTLHERFPDVPLNLPLELQAEQQRRFDSVASFFAALAARTPVLLIIEDAHWADSATLTLLRHLARRLRRAKVLIVVSHRETALDEMRLFHEWLGDLQRECLTTSINLVRLDEDYTRDLLAAFFKEAITPEFLDGIYHATEGNPFFVTEVCQALIDEGAVYRQGEGWQRLSMAQIQIPKSVRLAIQRRMDRLPEATQDTLQRAAVLGRELEFEVLQAMSDLSDDTFIDALDTAERAQLLTEVRGRQEVAYTFAHALIPSTLADGLSGVRRRRLHKRAAQALERVYAQRLGDFAAQIGRQYAEANDGEQAVPYLLQAGDRAREVYAYQKAIDHYQQALAFLKAQAPSGLAQAARTAMTLGQLYHTLFQFELSQQALDEGFDLWQRAQDAQTANPLPPAPHALRRYWPDVGSPDLTMANDTASGELVDQLFSGLVELTPDLDIAPDLAHRWEVFEDGRRYVFHLRLDARWSDGAPVTAHDFEYTWKRALNPTVQSSIAEDFLGLKGGRDYHTGRTPAGAVGVTALDDVTLAVELEEPIGHFLYLLASAVGFAIPRHVVEAYGEDWSRPEHIVTNGPFRLDTWRPGNTVVLVRNVTYHGRFSGNLARVELDLWNGSGESLGLYEQDQHDFYYWIGPETSEEARQRHLHEYVTAPHASSYYEVFDTTRPPFDDVRVRQAFTHAIDRQALANVGLRSGASPATAGLIPPGLPGHAANIGLAYDPERARQLLAEAGYPDGQSFPVIEAWEGYPSGFQSFFNFLTTRWLAELGIQVDWKHFEWVEYQKRLLTETPPIFAIGWRADYPDPDSFLGVAMHQPYMRWRHPDYERLLETARRSADQAERLKFYAAADRLLMQEAPILPVTHGRQDYLIKPWVKRYPISPLKASYWKDVIIEAH